MEITNQVNDIVNITDNISLNGDATITVDQSTSHVYILKKENQFEDIVQLEGNKPKNLEDCKIYWVPWKCGEKTPKGAILAGFDVPSNGFANQSPIYVGRAHYEKHLLPGKFCPDRHEGHVPYYTIPRVGEVRVFHGEILCAEQREFYTWEMDKFGNVPNGAVLGGFNNKKYPLYIGRVKIKTDLSSEEVTSIGKIDQTEKCCYVSFRGDEYRYYEYEVLVARNI